MPCASLPPCSPFFTKQIQRLSPRSWHRLLPPPPPPPPPPPLRPPANQPPESLVATIRWLSSAGRLSAAFAAFSHLRRRLPHSFSSRLDYPISSLLAASASLRSLAHGSPLHALALSLGFLPWNHHIVSRLGALYAACSLHDGARAAVEDSTVTVAFPWNIVLSAYVQDGYLQDAIFIYEMMLERGVRPDNFTYSSILRVCGKLRDLRFGHDVHRQIVSSGLEYDAFVNNAILAMYSNCGAVDHARKLFDEMPDRDIVSWNSMILGYTSLGRWEEASQLLERMRLDGVELNSISLNIIISGHLQLGNHTEALRLLSCASTQTNTWAVDSVSLVFGLKACSKMGFLKQGKEIHGLAIRSNCHEHENINNALMTLYSRCGNVAYTCIFLQLTSSRTVVTWNTMISAIAATTSIHRATIFLQEMIESKTPPNHTTIVTMISLFADAEDLRHGKELHCYATRHGLQSYLPIANSLLHLYCKSGNLSIALRVFDMMENRDRISYTTLIGGYGLQGNGMFARKLFLEMISRGIEPDEIAIDVLRSAWRRIRFHGGWNHPRVAANC